MPQGKGRFFWGGASPGSFLSMVNIRREPCKKTDELTEMSFAVRTLTGLVNHLFDRAKP